MQTNDYRQIKKYNGTLKIVMIIPEIISVNMINITQSNLSIDPQTTC